MSSESFHSIPSALYYLASQAKVWEEEKLSFELERIDLKQQLTSLQSEKKSNVALINTLYRRVDMLELALRAERVGKDGALPEKYIPLSNSAAETKANKSDDPMSPLSLAKATLAEFMKQAVVTMYQPPMPIPKAEEEPAPTSQPVPADSLKLGELADLTIEDTAIPDRTAVDHTNIQPVESTWRLKFSLKSHLDGVRQSAFTTNNNALISVSEDFTCKVWNLESALNITAKKASADIEPIATLRHHTAPVTCLAVSDSHFYTGSCDSLIVKWNIPPLLRSTYDSYDDSAYVAHTFVAHTNTVYDVLVHPTSNILASASADGTLKIWSTTDQKLLSNHLSKDTPISLSLVDTNTLAVGYTSGMINLLDLNTGSVKHSFESANANINDLLFDPSGSNMLHAGCEDRYIRAYDLRSQFITTSLLAHLNSISSLAAVPNSPSCIASTSHDCSVRIWDKRFTCLQELSLHNNKFEEGLWNVSLATNGKYMASSGADSLIKIYIKS